MRALALLAAALLLTVFVPQATANPVDPPFSPTCPYITSFATICVGGVLQCFVSVRLFTGDRICL
jgi:hypothetical protein